jgi:hypothetical protein
MSTDNGSLGVYNVVTLGEFSLGLHAVITDPCYDLGSQSAGTVITKPGIWKAAVMKSEGLCGLLYVWHTEYPISRLFNPLLWNKLPFRVAVDSGSAGVFDLDHYQDDESVAGVDLHYYDKLDIGNRDIWYTYCGDRIIAPPHAGVIPWGCVSSSGGGDGGYTAYSQGDMLVEAVSIDFLNMFGWEEEEEEA